VAAEVSYLVSHAGEQAMEITLVQFGPVEPVGVQEGVV
jgi:hypothetical protein